VENFSGAPDERVPVSTPALPHAPETAARPERRWFLHPLLLIGVSVVMSSASQILFKVATAATSRGESISPRLFTSWALWAGIVATLISLVTWLNALRSVPLILAFNLSAATYVVVPLGCWTILGEEIPPVRWVGIAFVTLGVMIMARPLSRMEERL
jgi:drug/metabolite transporter (DMT)-like permease